MEETWPRPEVQTERSEVCTHDRGQDSPIQFYYMANKNNVTGCVLADKLLANGDELNAILPLFAHPLYIFSNQAFWHFDK